MQMFFRNNGLTIVLVMLFLGSLTGHGLSGWYVENEELVREGMTPLSLAAYTVHPHFLASLFENWESEFLQMSAYVVLTAFLFQRGSAESADPDEPPRDSEISKTDAAVSWLYAHSLGIALLILFTASFVLHWIYSAREAASEAAMHGEPVASATDHLFSAQFWFESFQNWQSEFLSTAVLVVLSIFLRQRGSPESKPVAAPNSRTGA